MDASVGSDPNESQATQLLQELLELDTDSSRKLSDARSSALNPQYIHPNEISSDSLPSTKNSNSLPQYHFHGLASTQTQSQQYDDEAEVNEGSQKENIGAIKAGKEQGWSNPSPVSRPTSPHASGSKNAQVKAPSADKHVGSLPHSKPTGKKTSTAVTFQSPKPKVSSSNGHQKTVVRTSPYKPTMSRRNAPPPRRPRSRSSSQDSFAQDPDLRKEPEGEQFTVPLNELGRDSSPIRDASNATGGTSNISYPRGRQPVALSPPRGRVLVEATPSHSGASQSPDGSRQLSQQFEATQLIDEDGNEAMAVDRDGSGSADEDSEPSSSYKRFLDGHRDPEPDQPELQATQPSTQVEEPAIPSDDKIPWSNMRTYFSGPSRSGPSTPPQQPPPPSVGQSGPRPLISLVPPGNRWRYRQYESEASAQAGSHPGAQNVPPPSAQPSALQETQPSELQETQPSFDDEPPPRRTLPAPKASNLRRMQPPPPRVPSPMPIDAMEVVPDSEPMAEQDHKSPRKAAPSHAKPARRSTSRRVEDSDVDMDASDGGGKVVPGSDFEEEEEDDEEEEVPLAQAQKQTKKSINKGKGPASSMPPPSRPPTKPKVAAPLPPSKDKKGPAVVDNLTMRHRQEAVAGSSKRSWGSTEVPSSVPEQDLPEPRTTRTSKTTANQPAGKKKPAKAPPSRTRQRSRSKASTKQETEEESEHGDLPQSEAEDHEGTELADDDEEYEDEDPGPSKKRKRAPKAAANGKTTKAASKRPKRGAPTPVARQFKRLRSAVSTASRASIAQATRVFALWKQDCHYYPGTVYSVNTDSLYMIKFDDETEAWVNIEQIRLLRLQVGDDVLVPKRGRPSRVVNVDDQVNGHIQVEYDDEVFDVPVTSLRIANKTVLVAWEDRILSHQAVNPVLKPVKRNLSPSPSKLSMVSVPSVRGRKKVLAKTGLIVTLSAANGNWEKEKEDVMSAVKNSGGTVIDDLSTVFRMEGKVSQNGKGWIIHSTDLKWIGDSSIERLFLVADEPNQKPKFLTALALGVPCLTTQWLYESVESGEEKEWYGYMLAQGYSDTLHARPSQQVDLDWGNSVHQLSDIMNNGVPSKLFCDQHVLCVGSEMVPPNTKGRRRDDKTHDTMRPLPSIILAMGADTVEAVADAKYASKELSEYDYIVIREPYQYLPEYAETKTVHWAWVKESLIASRYLQLPSWETEYSQET